MGDCTGAQRVRSRAIHWAWERPRRPYMVATSLRRAGFLHARCCGGFGNPPYGGLSPLQRAWRLARRFTAGVPGMYAPG